MEEEAEEGEEGNPTKKAVISWLMKEKEVLARTRLSARGSDCPIDGNNQSFHSVVSRRPSRKMFEAGDG